MGRLIQQQAPANPNRIVDKSGLPFQTPSKVLFGSLERYLLDSTFNQVMTALNGADAQAASQLTSLLASYGDIQSFFGGLTSQQKQQLWQTLSPTRFNSIMAQMSLNQRKAWASYYICLAKSHLVPTATNGTTWQ